MYWEISLYFGDALRRSGERGLKRTHIGKAFKRFGDREFYGNFREYGYNNSEAYGSGLQRYHG